MRKEVIKCVTTDRHASISAKELAEIVAAVATGLLTCLLCGSADDSNAGGASGICGLSPTHARSIEYKEF